MECGTQYINGNNMSQFIEWFTSLGKAFSGHDFDAVDSNLVRYYRTEYGSRWKEELNHYLYNKNQKKRITMRKPIWAGVTTNTPIFNFRVNKKFITFK